ncbi:hypothetical protein ACQ4PT_000725 [Festuca glaucescens]
MRAACRYDYCFVRYDNMDFAGQADTDAGVILVNLQVEDSDPKAFEQAVGKVMGKAAAQASASGSAGLGRAKDQYTSFVNIYGLAQCTRDLAPLACAQCVSTALSRFGDYCGGAAGLPDTLQQLHGIVSSEFCRRTRHAIQLLSPASIVAKANGRDEISKADLEEVGGLYLDAKSSARLLQEHQERYIT